MNKIISYFGFAQKSNNIVTGQTALKKNKKQLFLIVVCSTASDNLKNLAQNLANKHGCECLFLKTGLKNLINFEDIKILGLTEENLSEAIIKEYSIKSI